MQTSNPKRPGEVQDSSGVGNDDFDAGKKESKYGYPVMALYELQTPLDSKHMKADYRISPPQGYYYAPEKLVEAVKVEDMEKLF